MIKCPCFGDCNKVRPQIAVEEENFSNALDEARQVVGDIIRRCDERYYSFARQYAEKLEEERKIKQLDSLKAQVGDKVKVCETLANPKYRGSVGIVRGAFGKHWLVVYLNQSDSIVVRDCDVTVVKVDTNKAFSIKEEDSFSIYDEFLVSLKARPHGIWPKTGFFCSPCLKEDRGSEPVNQPKPFKIVKVFRSKKGDLYA